MKDKRAGPQKVAETLERYLAGSGLGEKVEEARVVPEWAERVGPAIAAVTVPLRVSRGVLLVAVRTSPWLQELKLMEAEIRRRLNQDRERGRIQQIRFIMADPEATPGGTRLPPRGRKDG
jgi:predicted nucleic acid-binding Zn ribbon protein